MKNVSLVAVVLVCLAGSAFAVPLTIVNSSFEDPILSDAGATSSGAIPGWTASLSGQTSGGIHVWNPPVTEVDGATGNGTPVGADGTNVLLIWSTDNTGVAPVATAALTQTLSGETFQQGTYTLSVAVGKRKTQPLPADSIIILLTGTGTWLASLNVPSEDFVGGQFVTKSFTYEVVSGSPHIGEDVAIRLMTMPDATSATSSTLFDNVQLDCDVPAPATMGLLVLGGLALLAKKKKCHRNQSGV